MRAYWQVLPLQRRQYLARSVGIGVLLLFPFVDLMCNWQLLNAVTDAAVFVVLALGLNIVVGYAGLLDLGYAAFFAIGAYTTGILTWPPHGLELNFWWAMLCSVPVAALFGVILGAPTLRVRGDYLAIITLAFGEIVPIAFRNLWNIDIRIGGWTLVENFNLTNGPQGMNPVGRLTCWATSSALSHCPGIFSSSPLASWSSWSNLVLKNRAWDGPGWRSVRTRSPPTAWGSIPSRPNF